ncbi:hypothetical protein J6590_070226 [Homalodisca vitripennis]|nr:hypothetical protein J6590_070226 [Homalodisca vitripennis]
MAELVHPLREAQPQSSCVVLPSSNLTIYSNRSLVYFTSTNYLMFELLRLSEVLFVTTSANSMAPVTSQRGLPVIFPCAVTKRKKNQGSE